MRARVIYVSDGDTFGAHNRRWGDFVVRIIGIDTPETKDPDRPVECYGRKASTELTRLLAGERVTVAFQEERIDDYGRYLMDTWTPSGRFVAARMVRRGYARSLRIWPNDAHAPLLQRLESQAQRHDRGLWGACPDQ